MTFEHNVQTKYRVNYIQTRDIKLID